MKFYVTGTNEATLAVSGITTAGVNQTYTIVRSGVSGWTPNGSGIRLKRMTTIGQSTENLNSGSYMKGVHWHDITIGYYSGTSLIYSGWTSTQSGGYHLYNS